MHLVSLFVDELDLTGELNLSLTKIIQWLFLDLDELLDLGNKELRSYSVSAEDFVDKEEGSLVFT